MKAIGIVLAGGNSKRMGELTNRRAVAAMPVACGFRSIDFVLSNMTNSKISEVAVLTQYNSRSLNLHLNSPKWWDYGSKKSGLFVFNPTITPTSNEWYKGTADALYKNLDFLRDRHEPYVVIASGDGIYKMDFNDVLKAHIENQAEVTVVCKDIKDKKEAERFGCIKTDETGRITYYEEKPVNPDTSLVSCGIYLMRRRNLIEMIENCISDDRIDFVKDVLIRYRNVKNLYAYKFDGYWSNISSKEAYFKTNMDFLKPAIRDYFAEDPQIYTKIDDLPPAKYNYGSKVKNSLVASGCIINGTVENSLLFKDVFIGNNCIIRNSLILDDTYIGDGTVIENCIVEAHCRIRQNARYTGLTDDVKIIREKAGIFE